VGLILGLILFALGVRIFGNKVRLWVVFAFYEFQFGL
jgi:hypothetical protein